jgi:hypothetical protein
LTLSIDLVAAVAAHNADHCAYPPWLALQWHGNGDRCGRVRDPPEQHCGT